MDSKRFTFSKSSAISVLFILSIVLAVGAVVVCLAEMHGQWWAGLLLFIPSAICYLFYKYSYIELQDDCIVICYGIIKRCIAYSNIAELELCEGEDGRSKIKLRERGNVSRILFINDESEFVEKVELKRV